MLKIEVSTRYRTSFTVPGWAASPAVLVRVLCTGFSLSAQPTPSNQQPRSGLSRSLDVLLPSPLSPLPAAALAAHKVPTDQEDTTITTHTPSDWTAPTHGWTASSLVIRTIRPSVGCCGVSCCRCHARTLYYPVVSTGVDSCLPTDGASYLARSGTVQPVPPRSRGRKTARHHPQCG